MDLLRRHTEVHDHELGPLVPKMWWTHLGKLLCLVEFLKKGVGGLDLGHM